MNHNQKSVFDYKTPLELHVCTQNSKLYPFALFETNRRAEQRAKWARAEFVRLCVC